MKAHEWVKVNGWIEAKNLIEASGWRNTPFLIRVKRLVESHELVEKHGGLRSIKAHFKLIESISSGILSPHGAELKQAIADVEACQ